MYLHPKLPTPSVILNDVKFRFQHRTALLVLESWSYPLFLLSWHHRFMGAAGSILTRVEPALTDMCIPTFPEGHSPKHWKRELPGSKIRCQTTWLRLHAGWCGGLMDRECLVDGYQIKAYLLLFLLFSSLKTLFEHSRAHFTFTAQHLCWPLSSTRLSFPSCCSSLLVGLLEVSKYF
jgi:hypothetical protein